MPQSVGDCFHLGFLRVVEVHGAGYVGGMLVANRLGRPLEFQCTTPVKPNRTQEILYGPTLLPFVFSDLIGKTLYERLSVKPHVIFVDQESLLDLRNLVPASVGCLLDEAAVNRRELPDQTRLQIGRQTLRLHPEHPEDLSFLEERCKHLPGDADLREPLDRVRDALQETLRAGAAA